MRLFAVFILALMVAVGAKAAPIPKSQPAKSKALLIIPLQVTAEKILLWEPENLWAKAWATGAMVYGRGNIVVPAGDSNDQNLLDAYNARSASLGRTAPLLERYGATQALIAEAAMDDTATPVLHVVLKQVETAGNAKIFAKEYPRGANEDTKQLMARAVTDMTEVLRAGSGSAGGLQKREASREEKTLLVTAPLRDLNEWLELRATLLTLLPPLTKLELMTLAPTQAQLTFYFTGEPKMLLEKLQQAGLTLEHKGADWILRAK